MKRKQRAWLTVPFLGLFLLAALCGCGQGETPVEQPKAPAQVSEPYEIQKDDAGGCMILQEGAVVGGVEWIPYPGAEEVDFAACLEPTAEEAAREPLGQVLATLFDQRLGEDAEAPDYSASVSNVADLEVTFATDQGSEAHYLAASGDAFYNIWFREGVLLPGTERELLDELLAEAQSEAEAVGSDSGAQ